MRGKAARNPKPNKSTDGGGSLPFFVHIGFQVRVVQEQNMTDTRKRGSSERTSSIFVRSPLFAVIFFSWSAFAGSRTLPDQIVPTPVGNLRVTDLKCNHAGGVLIIQGRIANETGRPFDSLRIAMEFHDKNGLVTKKNPSASSLTSLKTVKGFQGFVAVNVGSGASMKLDYRDFQKADKDTFSVKFSYSDGRYPVHYRAVLTKPVMDKNLEYHNDSLSIAFSLQKTEIEFVLHNNSDEPIKIDWNLVSFVQPNGASQGVIHKGVKLVDRQASKPPSMVPPKANLEDIIVPVENVRFQDGEWQTDKLFPDGPAASSSIGTEFSVFMPMDVGGIVKNYTFTFKLVGVD